MVESMYVSKNLTYFLISGSPIVLYIPFMAQERHGLLPDHLYLSQTTWEARG